ncbi:reverse transcriptase (RNA-dependent DNA polymerase) domain-containing protein [Phthorimaea operculella]|nr:reverse transcriptase (RNA-dependent DNA polymerase) domain-containing protein [Phthorimaea operculella]
MPFGLTNAPATQQRFLDSLLSDLMCDNSVFCYLDDIVIATSTFERHVEILNKLLTKLTDANITINFPKCSFFRNELKYLGFIVNSQGLQTDPDKVKAILDIPVPKTAKDVKKFLGTVSWYRRFVPNLSTLATPLNKLTSTHKKAPPFKWTPEAESAFNSNIQALVSTPILACPDFTKPFAVHCDASSFGIGAMLTQEFDGIEKPIAYMSKSLTHPQRNYSITERELLSVITALEHWRCYLDNDHKFTIYTDHSALQWFLRLDNPTETVILDNGPQMTSPELTNMFHSYKIPHIHFIPLHCPQVNTVERYNRTIITAVASFVNDDHRTWDKHLHKIQFAINSSVNESTKFTPAFLVFGRELVPCGSTYFQKDTTDDLIFAPRDIYAENLGQLIPIFDKVQSRLHSIHQNNASHYNKHRQNLEFEPGDIVWKRNYPISSSDKNFSAKLAPKYIKCIVSQKISPLVYNLTDTNNNNLGRWHIKDLKPTKTAKQPN